MKKVIFYFMLAINVLILASFAVIPSMAAEVVDTDTIYWNWEGPTPGDSGLPSADPIANDLEFRLYMSYQSNVYNFGTPDVVISYTSAIGTPYGNEFNLTISGVGGATVTIYFVLTAWYDSGESGPSNEVSKTVTIPKDRPLNLRFTIYVE